MPQYDEGMNACLGGMGRNFNSYVDGGLLWAAWDLGWVEADDQNN